MSRLPRIFGAVALSFGLVNCGGDSFSPTVEVVAGIYHASTFTFNGGSGTTDLLALGATVTITLAADGTTSGRMLVPGVAEGGEDLDADLAGTWVLSGTTVTFEQDADTFMRDVPFTASPNRLRAQGTFGEEVVVLVLTK
jgi:hypothetical protein